MALSIEETGAKLIEKVVVPPEDEELVLQILLLSEGGFSTERVGAAPVIAVAVNVKVLLSPIVTVCVVLGIPIIVGGSHSGHAILKKKSIGIYDLLSPLPPSKSSTIIKDNHMSFTLVACPPLSRTFQVTKPEVLNVIPVGCE